MVAVRHDDLSMAVDFVSCAAPAERNAYVSLDSGKVCWTSDSSDAFDDEVPDDIESSDRYLAIPHKNELDLGRRLVLHFVAQELPLCYDEVEGFFRRQGAYARFKDGSPPLCVGQVGMIVLVVQYLAIAGRRSLSNGVCSFLGVARS
jgi:hypothetical protein